MKIALLISVVAFVAGQPLYYPQPPAPVYNPCRAVYPTPYTGNVDDEPRCCFPKIYGGCTIEPGRFFAPGMPVPPYFQAPAGYLPSPGFLRAVCCPPNSECCPQDQSSTFPVYNCCGEDEACTIYDKKGTCSPAPGNNTGTTIDAEQLDGQGRCPDGSLPLIVAPGQPFQCTLNRYIPTSTEASGCPASSHCVKDRSGNVNSGVCCRNSACEDITDCSECVSNRNNITGGCSFLTQGDLYSPYGKCVSNCQNFPAQSCIVGGRTESVANSLCPRTATNPNGTNFNTGTCNRRCGMVGTGRSSRINNGTWPVGEDLPDNQTLACCRSFPGDYCCNYNKQLSSNCAFGRVPAGPICGVPVRGSPATLYNTRPSYGYGRPVPYAPYAPYMMPPMYYGGMYRQYSVYGGYGYGMPAPGFGMYGPQVYNLYRPPTYYPPPPPMYRPPVPMPPPYVAPPVDQRPSPFICSCDFQCTTYMDCCDDFKSFCCSNTSNSSACN